MLSTIKSSNRKIEIIGASFSDPGAMNQKLMNRVKKILNVINLRRISLKKNENKKHNKTDIKIYIIQNIYLNSEINSATYFESPKIFKRLFFENSESFIEIFAKYAICFSLKI